MLNVMVVDDSTIIRRILTKELEEMGHKVIVEAKSGREAVAEYALKMPDLVTMDITMPGIDGIEALRKIKKKFKSAKIIMITSHGEEKRVMEAITSGAKGYILKPINKFELSLAIKKVFPELYPE